MIYCPKCATPQSEELKFCRACGFDLQIVSRALGRENTEVMLEQGESTESGPPKTRRAKMEMRGLLALFTALMVGCLIPIARGLFPNWSGLNNFMIVLGGLAGFILFGGILMLVYSDYLPKTEATQPSQPTRMPSFPQSVPTNQLPPANESEAVPNVTERTTGLLPTPASKASQKDA
jgi:hypothetical protein